MKLRELERISAETRQILVFRSNINNDHKVNIACSELAKIIGVHGVNVDLSDREYVLRVECEPEIPASMIEEQVSRLGFECSELSD